MMGDEESGRRREDEACWTFLNTSVTPLLVGLPPYFSSGIYFRIKSVLAWPQEKLSDDDSDSWMILDLFCDLFSLWW
jgi:hypothetical protein